MLEMRDSQCLAGIETEISVETLSVASLLTIIKDQQATISDLKETVRSQQETINPLVSQASQRTR